MNFRKLGLILALASLPITANAQNGDDSHELVKNALHTIAKFTPSSHYVEQELRTQFEHECVEIDVQQISNGTEVVVIADNCNLGDNWTLSGTVKIVVNFNRDPLGNDSPNSFLLAFTDVIISNLDGSQTATINGIASLESVIDDSPTDAIHTYGILVSLMLTYNDAFFGMEIVDGLIVVEVLSNSSFAVTFNGSGYLDLPDETVMITEDMNTSDPKYIGTCVADGTTDFEIIGLKIANEECLPHSGSMDSINSVACQVKEVNQLPPFTWVNFDGTQTRTWEFDSQSPLDGTWAYTNQITDNEGVFYFTEYEADATLEDICSEN